VRRAVRLLLFLGPWVLFVGPHVLWGRPPVSEIPVDAFFDDVTGVIIVAAGLVVWDRRPGSRVGPLLALAGYLWYVGSIYQYVPVDSPLQYVSTILRGYYEPILAFVILTFPGGRFGFDARELLTFPDQQAHPPGVVGAPHAAAGGAEIEAVRLAAQNADRGADARPANGSYAARTRCSDHARPPWRDTGRCPLRATGRDLIVE